MAYRRYRDLVARGLVKNRATLRNRILKNGFPPGRLLGPNDRAWTDEELEEYEANRPVEPRAGNLPPPPEKGRPRSRKGARQLESTTP
jgi:predicted DNA-binding transcriptional regulator AlpA